MKGFENDFDDSNRFFVKSAGTTPKRTTTPKMKRKKMRRRSGRSDDDDDEVFFFFFFFVDAGEEGDARLLRPPNPSSSSIFFFLLRINKQRGGEGGKKNEEDEEQKKKEQKQKKQRFFRFFLLFCFALPVFADFFDLKISPYQTKEGKKVSLTEKVTFLLFYIAPHKTRAQNAKHSPLSRSKIHIFDSYILQVKRSTRGAINGSFAHHPQTNKRIVIWKSKKIPSSIFFYKKRP